ncbi:hypothetical protein CBER1_03456 [Cercospora berteroae]|uniref:Alcohol dehydrogenase-like N-terminal domain-containing protein n=1 Tax=Cercospora berteroae TaxID=357750 RepID=A0A2S6CLU2_9PEZI|nr:hypothetical protein CBER1_03456 [Cercospora berteroae]
MSGSHAPTTMRAVVYKGPYEVAVEDKPYPKIQHDTDCILKVTTSALCGSDLHFYRGKLKVPAGFVCGHEFVGDIVEIGDKVEKLSVGERSYSHSTQPAGTASTASGAKHRAAIKDNFSATLYPQIVSMAGKPKLLVLMADIFPTGYFATSRFLKNLELRDRENFTSIVVGCGPVGICAIACAVTMVDTVYAIDSVPERLEEAAALGAIPIHLTEQDPIAEIMKATDGLDFIRPWGSISSVGMHNHALALEGVQLYSKNVTLAFGRCPVRSIFEDALALLVEQQDKVKWLCGKTMSLEDAPEAYGDFEARKVHKVLFKAAAV